MTPLLVDKIANALVFLAFLVMWWSLLRLERRPYIRLWGLAYALFVAYTGCTIGELIGVWPLALVLTGRLLLVGATASLLAGTQAFLGRRLSRWWLALVIALVGWIAIAASLGLSAEILATPIFWALGGVLLMTGIQLARGHTPGVGRPLAAVGFVLLGLYLLSDPFINHLAWYPAVEDKIDLVLILFVSVGIMVMHFEQARVEASASEQRTRSLFDNALDGLFRCESTGRLLDANPALLRMLGYSSVEDLPGLPALCSVDEDREAVGLALAKVAPIRAREVRLRSAPGAELQVILDLRPRADGPNGPPRFEGSVHDVTLERQMQQQLVHAQRMESLGRLAGGIAHDFNNILTVVLGGIDLTEMEIGSDHPLENLRSARQATLRAVELTTQLLTFSRHQAVERERLDLNQCTNRALEMVRRLLREDIELWVDLHPTSLWVRASASQIEQVVLNLLLNARDAIPQSGSISVTTSRWTDGEGTHQARLTVSDTGQGMDAETLSKVFEPFFSTKGEQGTGLGLATVYGIVNRLDGGISADSAPGRGSRFEVDLPIDISDTDVAIEAQREPTRASSVATVLVVEDEPELRRMVQRVLEAAGHRVEVARGGPDALEILEHRPHDLVVTDVIMPGMSGAELVSQIRERHRDQRALFISGYSEERLGREALRGIHLLGKPFTPEQLTAAVDRALGRNQ